MPRAYISSVTSRSGIRHDRSTNTKDHSRGSTTNNNVFIYTPTAFRVLTNFAKWNFLSFPGFPDPLNGFFPYNYNVKTRCNKPPYQPFRYLSCSNAELQNIFLSSMVTGSTHSSHCVTQPIYAWLVVGFRLHHRNIPSDFQKFPEYISNFPEFSRI